MKQDKEQFIKDFVKNSHKVTLTRRERGNIKRMLIAYMESGVREGAAPRLHWQRSEIKFKRLMPILLAITLVFTGGTALAANSALPGDALYPVKVNFNEKVRGALAFSSEAEANFHADMAARRLHELQQLALSGEADIDADLKESALVNFEMHTENALLRISELEAKEKVEAAASASSRLGISLQAHEEVLERLTERSEDLRERLLGIAERVHSRTEAATEARANAINKIEAQTSARLEVIVEHKAEDAQDAISNAKRWLNRYESRLTNDARFEAQAKIEAAEEVYVEGQAALDEESYTEAFRHFQTAIDLANQASVTIRIWVSLDIDVDDDKSSDESKGQEKSNEDKSDNSDKDESGDSEAEVDVEAETRGSVKVNPPGLNLNSDFDLESSLNLRL